MGSKQRENRVTGERAVRRRKHHPGSVVTVDRILEAGLDVLFQHGYAQFTLRRVAQAARLSAGNLAYHFPTKRDLVRALVARQVEHYSDRANSVLDGRDNPAESALEALTRYFMIDSASDRTMRIGRELWAMALHDPIARRAIDDFYDHSMERIAQALHRAQPKADMEVLREVVHLMTLLTEGTTVIYGTSQKRAISLARSIEMAKRALASIALVVRTEDAGGNDAGRKETPAQV